MDEQPEKAQTQQIPSPDPERDRDANPARSEAAEDAETLRELTRINMSVAGLIEANAKAKMAENPACDLGRVDQMIGRVSRSVRQTLAFKAKLAEMRGKQAVTVETEARERAADAERLRRRKVKLERAVAETIEADAARGRTDRENLLSDLHERLLEPDIEAMLASASIGELVASICDDLDIPPDRSVWKKKGWYLTENWHARWPKPEPGPPLDSGTEAAAARQRGVILCKQAAAEIDAFMGAWSAASKDPSLPYHGPDDG
jgi:hypothetical protein